MPAYYNEIDPFAAQWLRNLIAAGHIAPGEVDTRSIEDVTPDDLRGFQQCHFFAGIGIWSRALRDAGWPDDRMAWTGSCPCQPFSAAGKRGGVTDERHLWPAWHHLIAERRPPVVFGEQVASKDGLAWLDTVQADLEASGYAVGAADLCAAGVGAPHIRQRLWFVGVGVTDSAGRSAGRTGASSMGHRGPAIPTGSVRGLADGSIERRLGGRSGEAGAKPGEIERPERLCDAGGVADSDGGDTCAERLQRSREHGQQPQDGSVVRMADDAAEREGSADHGTRAGDVSGAREDLRPSPTNGLWRDADWLCCRDGKWRPVRPGTFPLVNGAPSRVGRLRAYGNAIVAEAAREFIGAVMDALGSS